MEETREQMMERLNSQRTLVRELEELLIINSPLAVKEAVNFLIKKYAGLAHDLGNAIQVKDCAHFLRNEELEERVGNESK